VPVGVAVDVVVFVAVFAAVGVLYYIVLHCFFLPQPLLWDMAGESHMPHGSSYSVAITACERCGPWWQAGLLPLDMQSNRHFMLEAPVAESTCE